MELLKGHNVDVRGKHVLVVGRSPIVGSPMALMLRDAGATVSVAHKSSRDADEGTFRDLVSKCDVLISCAGSPGAIHADWLKEGVIVINVGTHFCETANALLSDIEGDVESRAAKYSPVPGGVGPLSVPMLFRNVAKAAWDQMECGTSDTWTKEPATLR
jgi:5,10-methylene-tetrahydrofolate dehydrogenase/methenyl tetrahydrofolate cyclohydrolase